MYIQKIIFLFFYINSIDSFSISRLLGLTKNIPEEALYLTKYIRENNINEAIQKSTVTLKPDNEAVNSIKSYSGYLTVNETYNSNLFFWYFVAQNNPESAPIILWLQGGPGASSLYGLFYENGPFYIDDDKNLINRKYSWHLNHHLIYIDNPVGSGFSFTDNDLGYARNEEMVGNNLSECLIQFFTLFSNLQNHDLYITGESYAGKYVPAAAYALHFRMQAQNYAGPMINLKGLAIGNGKCDPLHQLNYGDYLYQLGLIDLNGLKLMYGYQNQSAACIRTGNIKCASASREFLLDTINSLTGFQYLYNYVKADFDGINSINKLLELSDELRESIHVGRNTFHESGHLNSARAYLEDDIVYSVAPFLTFLLSHYKVLIYNGQLDIIDAYPLTENYLQLLPFSGSQEYETARRVIWRVDNEIAGYYKQGGNLTDVLVRNAGHMVPHDQPKWAYDMILRFTMGKEF